jgi:hypothetical protein
LPHFRSSWPLKKMPEYSVQCSNDLANDDADSRLPNGEFLAAR